VTKGTKTREKGVNPFLKKKNDVKGSILLLSVLGHHRAEFKEGQNVPGRI
jgi:hypothetical protein